MTSSIKQINNFYCHSVTGEIDNSFVGIKILNERIDFFYPEAYDLAPTDNVKQLRKDILAILNTISIAKTLSQKGVKIETTLSETDSFAISSYLWLIRDYLINGLYVNREKVFQEKRKGKINWKRTFQKQPSIVNKKVIYTDIVVEVPNYADNIIVEIHKICLHESIAIIGWLFGLSPKLFNVSQFNLNKKKQYISILTKELNNTFDDYKKLRFTHMLKVLKGISDEDKSNGFVYGIDNYFYVFERMVNHILGNVADINKFNPKAHWFIKNLSYKKVQSSELRPDTVYIDKKSKIAYVIDSKYYRYGVTGNIFDLPESSSIQKQITYGEYIMQNHLGDGIENVRNAFVLPYNKNSNIFSFCNDLEYIGFSKADWKDNTKEHQTVHAFLIDLKHVINSYNVKNTNAKDIDYLINEIEEEIAKLN